MQGEFSWNLNKVERNKVKQSEVRCLRFMSPCMNPLECRCSTALATCSACNRIVSQSLGE